jgi:hypothetical protein
MGVDFSLVNHDKRSLLELGRVPFFDGAFKLDAPPLSIAYDMLCNWWFIVHEPRWQHPMRWSVYGLWLSAQVANFVRTGQMTTEAPVEGPLDKVELLSDSAHGDTLFRLEREYSKFDVGDYAYNLVVSPYVKQHFSEDDLQLLEAMVAEYYEKNP